MKVLLTGSAGFLGGYLVEELLTRGYEVVGLDNFSRHRRVACSTDVDPRYRLVEGDARDTELVYELLDGCDHLIAGAAMVGGVAQFHTLAYDLLATNERITASTCEAAIRRHRAGSLQKVTYLSSSMVYESALTWPSHEGQERHVAPPRLSYGFQKLAVEYFARAAYEQYGLPFTIVRPFNCVGVGEYDVHAGLETPESDGILAFSHVVPDLVLKVLTGQDPLHILGTGQQLRCYTYGGDIARGIAMAMEHPGAINDDFNVSTSQSTTVLELAGAIWRKVHGRDVPLRVVHDDPFRNDVQRQIASTKKAARVLGFEATTSLDQMLDEVIAWVERTIIDGRTLRKVARGNV